MTRSDLETAGNGAYYRQGGVWFYTRTRQPVPEARTDEQGLVAPEVTAFRLLDYFTGAAYLNVSVSVMRTYVARSEQYEFPTPVWSTQGRNGTPVWPEPILGQWRDQHPAKRGRPPQELAQLDPAGVAAAPPDTAGNGNYYRVEDAWFYSIDHSPVPDAATDHVGLWAPELVAWRLLDTAGVAALLGVQPATVRALGRTDQHYLPPPVARFGRRAPVWSRLIIERYVDLRPGPGRWRPAPRFDFEGRAAVELSRRTVAT
jgi:hypothetical protein